MLYLLSTNVSFPNTLSYVSYHKITYLENQALLHNFLENLNESVSNKLKKELGILL